MKQSHVFKLWLEKNREFLEKCRGKNLAVTFSAGKDSSVCQYFLNEVKSEYSFNLSAFLCAFPHHRYTEDITDRLRSYWEDKGVKLTVQNPDEPDEIMGAEANPGRPCQNVRKKSLPEIFNYLQKPPAETVIVSGHSLCDIAAYSLNRQIASGLADPDSGSETLSEKRLLEISQRFYPFFTMPEGYSVYRPLLHINQPEIHSFCRENSIPVIDAECRYSEWRPKNNLSDFFEKFGYSFSYEKVFNFAATYLNIIPLEKITGISSGEYLGKHF